MKTETEDTSLSRPVRSRRISSLKSFDREPSTSSKAVSREGEIGFASTKSCFLSYDSSDEEGDQLDTPVEGLAGALPYKFHFSCPSSSDEMSECIDRLFCQKLSKLFDTRVELSSLDESFCLTAPERLYPFLFLANCFSLSVREENSSFYSTNDRYV